MNPQPEQMRLSVVHEEQTSYLRFDRQGNTEVYKQMVPAPNYSFRQIHSIPSNNSIDPTFTDFDYDLKKEINITDIDPQKGKIVIRRLNHLYAETNRPAFFPNRKPTRPADPSAVPNTIIELALFSLIDYKSLFLTQDFQPSGKYSLVVNVNGRFERIDIDDKIPVYENTLQPIWGLSFQKPWQILLLKAWAKRMKGYGRVRDSRPFQFLESFSNSNWKYYNLTKDVDKFINYYSQNNRFRNGKIIFKTKNANEVRASGLIPDVAAYQLLDMYIDPTQEDKKINIYLTIRGTVKHEWTGNLSFIDRKLNDYYNQKKPQLALERDLIMNQTDFKNIFAAAYISANRSNTDSYAAYKLVQIQPQEKKAFHLQFYYPKERGFFDFSIKQFETNRIKPSEKSRVNYEGPNNEGQEVERYLKNKYILVKDNRSSKVKKYQKQQKKQQSGLRANQSGLRANQSGLRANQSGLRANDYQTPRFQQYQIQYLKGYNRGDAHFVNITEGRYILRIKSQTPTKKAKYAINWTSDAYFEVNESKITDDERIDLLHDSMVSIMHKVPHYNLDKKTNSQMISFSNTFQEIGYGYVAIKTKFDCPRHILIEVNPEQLERQGYTLKGKFKGKREKFGVNVENGQYISVVLKKNNKVENYIWPPTAITISKRELRRPQSGVNTSNISNIKGSEIIRNDASNQVIPNNPNNSLIPSKPIIHPTESYYTP